jgi:hypothetical protein
MNYYSYKLVYKLLILNFHQVLDLIAIQYFFRSSFFSHNVLERVVLKVEDIREFESGINFIILESIKVKHYPL